MSPFLAPLFCSYRPQGWGKEAPGLALVLGCEVPGVCEECLAPPSGWRPQLAPAADICGWCTFGLFLLASLYPGAPPLRLAHSPTPLLWGRPPNSTPCIWTFAISETFNTRFLPWFWGWWFISAASPEAIGQCATPHISIHTARAQGGLRYINLLLSQCKHQLMKLHTLLWASRPSCSNQTKRWSKILWAHSGLWSLVTLGALETWRRHTQVFYEPLLVLCSIFFSAPFCPLLWFV